MEKPFDLKAVRASLGLSQSDIAEAIGVDQASVSKWESGQRNPSGPARKLLDQFIAHKRAEDEAERAA